MEYTFGDEMIPVGGVGSINLTITTKRGSVYQPMDMEIIMPFVSNFLCETSKRNQSLNHVSVKAYLDLNWILYEPIWKRCHFRFRTNVNKP